MHEDEVTEGIKSIANASPLDLITKEKVFKVKISKEKVFVDFDSDVTDDEFTREEMALMVSNPK